MSNRTEPDPTLTAEEIILATVTAYEASRAYTRALYLGGIGEGAPPSIVDAPDEVIAGANDLTLRILARPEATPGDLWLELRDLTSPHNKVLLEIHVAAVRGCVARCIEARKEPKQ